MSPDESAFDIEEHARIAAQLAVHEDRPRAEVLAPFGLSEAEWDDLHARFTARLAGEIRTRSGSSAPLEERFPLAASYAKAYADAAREAQRAPEEQPPAPTAPASSPGDPLSVLVASNLAAASEREKPG